MSVEGRKVDRLIDYAILNKLIKAEDTIYVRNRLLSILGEKSCEEEGNIKDILSDLSSVAVSSGKIDNTFESRENLECRLMDVLISKPSEIIEAFYTLYKVSPKKATEYFYNFSKASNNVKVNDISKNKFFKVTNSYGTFDITINLSKPEGGGGKVVKVNKASEDAYPKCVLCKETEGFEGNDTLPPRANHRMIPISVNNKKWLFYYSPYAYFNEHMILVSENHTPMKISSDTFIELLELVDKFPHYKIGSNADLKIVGGSLLAHNHYQGGNYEFPLENAEIEKELFIKGYEDVKITKVKWPVTIIRITSKNKEKVSNLATKIFEAWKIYDDERREILSSSKGEQHSTITPIARFVNGEYEINLALRNNRVSSEYPYGIFNPRKEVHNIKRENIGLIEVLGLAVLPGRLDYEMGKMKEYLLAKDKEKRQAIGSEIEIHIDFLNSILEKTHITPENVEEVIKEAVGNSFVKALENCAVFKNSEEGRRGFERFIEEIN